MMEEEEIFKILRSFGFKDDSYGGVEGNLRGVHIKVCIHPLKGLSFLGYSLGKRSLSEFEEFLNLNRLTQQKIAQKIYEIVEKNSIE